MYYLQREIAKSSQQKIGFQKFGKEFLVQLDTWHHVISLPKSSMSSMSMEEFHIQKVVAKVYFEWHLKKFEFMTFNHHYLGDPSLGLRIALLYPNKLSLNMTLLGLNPWPCILYQFLDQVLTILFGNQWVYNKGRPSLLWNSTTII